MSQRVFITGTAGFIGFHLAKRLLDLGHEVFGIDNFNDYYSVQLKRDRHVQLEQYKNYQWEKCDLCDAKLLQSLMTAFQPDCVVNLAAQAGVRHSIDNPHVYQQSNIEGFLNILECCRSLVSKPRLIYASSSSVYGGNKELPFTESQPVDNPVSLYAATKKANELMAHSYSHLFGLQTIGLRFFTVYGPWGRPDMAYWLFTEQLLHGKTINVFNHGEMYRDFTYIDDVISGVVGCISASSLSCCDVFNIGNNRSEKLMDLIKLIANKLNISHPTMEFLPMQDGDIPATYASIDKLHAAVGYQPTTSISIGIPKFVEWFRTYQEKL
jgi:UDP-glucuronate 4-epimerase